MTRLTIGAVVLAVGLALAALPAVAQNKKLSPGQTGGAAPAVRAPSPSVSPALKGGTDPASFSRQIDGMAAMESQLDRAFQDFKREHQSAIQVGRRAAAKNQQCHDKVHGGTITETDRRAACNARMDENACAYAVYEHCQQREMADYRDSQARLSVKREQLERLLDESARGTNMSNQRGR
jgi:hypothetical protein